MNSLEQLQDCGQSIWLDYIRRDLITSGEFQRLVEEDGVHGVTSNPTIFDKAIAAGTTYDDALRLLLSADPDRDAQTLFESLEIQDLQMAADILRPVYDQTEAADGFVSIEVSPRLAYDAAASIAEAQRLWKAVNRPNLMVKIPSTVLGLPFEMGMIRNHYVGRTFIQPSQSVRDFGVKIKLNPVRDLLKGKRVVVIEDSIVRGTTSRTRIRALRDAGVKEVHMRVSCPPHRFPCHYGIDFPTRE